MPNNGDQASKVSIDAVKTSINNALTKTSKTYTWQTTINVGTQISTSQFVDLKDATDTAYNALVLDCPTHNSTNDAADYGNKTANYTNCTNRTYS